MQNPSNNRYYILDALGHTRLLLDSTGGVKDSYVYDAWGNLLQGSELNTPNPFTWNGAYGYEWLEFTGLFHVGAREYDPRTARWLQRDPIGVGGGHPNVYLYCGNEPINCADSEGLDTRGHHYVPQSIFKKDCVKGSEAYSTFRHATTGSIPGGHNYEGHSTYNRAVKEMWDKWLKKNSIDPKKMTKEQAEEFIEMVKSSKHKHIRPFLKKIHDKIAITKNATSKKSPTTTKSTTVPGKSTGTAFKNAAKRGGFALTIFIGFTEIAEAAPCDRKKVTANVTGQTIGSIAGATLLGSFVPGIGHLVGGAIGGYLGGKTADWLYNLFD